MSESSQDHTASQSEIKPEDIHMPPNSFWPIMLALGISLILAGLSINFSIIIFGLILTLVAVVGWVTESGFAPEDH